MSLHLTISKRYQNVIGSMQKFGKSQATKRREDVRFLTGQGRYVANIGPENSLCGYVLRSNVAHAEIRKIDLAAARLSEGVESVISFEDLQDAGVTNGLDSSIVLNIDGTKGASPFRPILAKDKVRFVGEPIAFIVAETLNQARDAAELVNVSLKELPVHLNLSTGGELIHREAEQNIAFDWGTGDEEATRNAFDKASHRSKLEVVNNRVIVNSLEPRGCYAEWDGTNLHVCVNGQGVWDTKARLARVLSLPSENIRVTNPDVGGGFGMKAMVYPETILCAYATICASKPVKWFSDRSEAMVSDNSGRDLVSTAELAFNDDFKITAYRVNSLCNLGAYNSQFAQNIQTELFSKVLMGPYDVQNTWINVKGIYTNTTQVDAYRGAGRPEAIYLLERAMDRAAREFGIDPWELRRRNFIEAAAFPYKTATGETYDVGDFHKVLDHAEQSADLRGYAERKARSLCAGKLRGQGLCYYIESILGDPSETSKVDFVEGGGVDIIVGTQSNGQGHETTYAQFLSDQTGIPYESINVLQGDSDLIPHGGGTGGSRSSTVQNNAILVTVGVMIEAFSAFLADKLEVECGDINFDDERFYIKGSNLAPSILDCVHLARTDGRLDLMSHQSTGTLEARSFPNGAHVAEVEIDPATGVVKLDRYTVVDDFGNLFNPRLVEGQVHGGVVQGIGQAINEHVVFDKNGQLLTGSFMDYGMPRAKDVPFITFETEPIPSKANSMGVKGCGEAGTVGALAAVANAVQDAVWESGVRQADMPFTPLRVWQMLQAG